MSPILIVRARSLRPAYTIGLTVGTAHPDVSVSAVLPGVDFLDEAAVRPAEALPGEAFRAIGAAQPTLRFPPWSGPATVQTIDPEASLITIEIVSGMPFLPPPLRLSVTVTVKA